MPGLCIRRAAADDAMDQRRRDLLLRRVSLYIWPRRTRRVGARYFVPDDSGARARRAAFSQALRRGLAIDPGRDAAGAFQGNFRWPSNPSRHAAPPSCSTASRARPALAPLPPRRRPRASGSSSPDDFVSLREARTGRRGHRRASIRNPARPTSWRRLQRLRRPIAGGATTARRFPSKPTNWPTMAMLPKTASARPARNRPASARSRSALGLPFPEPPDKFGRTPSPAPRRKKQSRCAAASSFDPIAARTLARRRPSPISFDPRLFPNGTSVS